jgi:hypothetical protein
MTENRLQDGVTKAWERNLGILSEIPKFKHISCPKPIVNTTTRERWGSDRTFTVLEHPVLEKTYGQIEYIGDDSRLPFWLESKVREIFQLSIWFECFGDAVLDRKTIIPGSFLAHPLMRLAEKLHGGDKFYKRVGLRGCAITGNAFLKKDQNGSENGMINCDGQCVNIMLYAELPQAIMNSLNGKFGDCIELPEVDDKSINMDCCNLRFKSGFNMFTIIRKSIIFEFEPCMWKPIGEVENPDYRDWYEYYPMVK